MQPFILSWEQLLTDLYVAYYDARRHKRNKPYQQKFEENLAENLQLDLTLHEGKVRISSVSQGV